MPQTHNIVTVRPALPNAGAYSDGDAVGSVFALDHRSIAGGGTIATVGLADAAGQSAVLDLILFNASPATATADNAAFSIAAADKGKVLGVIKLATASGDYSAVGSGQSVVTNSTRNLPLTFGSTADGKLYAQLINRGSPTYADGDLTVIFGILV